MPCDNSLVNAKYIHKSVKTVALTRGARLLRGASINFQGPQALTRSTTRKIWDWKLFRPICLFKVREA